MGTERRYSLCQEETVQALWAAARVQEEAAAAGFSEVEADAAAEVAAVWAAATVRDQAQADIVFARNAERKLPIRQGPRVIQLTAPDAARRWQGSRLRVAQLLNYYDQYVEKIENSKQHGYDIEASRDFILSKAGPLEGRILEIGTGKGYLAVTLARKGYNFTSIDISREEQIFACAVLAHLGLADNVKLMIFNAAKTRFKRNSFNTIISCNALHHMTCLEPVFEEMLRILAPGGKIVLSDFSLEGLKVIDKIHKSRGDSHNYGEVNFEEISAFFERKGLKTFIYRNNHNNVLVAKS
jgi:SAM-dependent methyltransferase